MHRMSYEQMKKQLLPLFERDAGAYQRVVEVGSLDVNGTYRSLMPEDVYYVGVDLRPGPNVDVQMTGEYCIPLPSQSADIVISGQTLEHCRNPFQLTAEMVRLLRPGGKCVIAAPSSWPEHHELIDCFRIGPDGMKSILEEAGLRDVKVWEVKGDGNNMDCWGTGGKAEASAFRRNLIYHVCPFEGNIEWQLNVDRLREFWHLFNGRKIVGIVQDDRMVDAETVKRSFPDPLEIEWLISPNNRVCGESVTFLPAANMLKSLNPDEATFYAHTKGVSRARRLYSVRQWRNHMYSACLGCDRERLDWVLSNFVCAGCLRRDISKQERGRLPSWWMYPGNFFWINHARFFCYPEALILGSSRCSLEYHFGAFVPIEESYCFTDDMGLPRRIYGWTRRQWNIVDAQLDPNAVRGQLPETTVDCVWNTDGPPWICQRCSYCYPHRTDTPPRRNCSRAPSHGLGDTVAKITKAVGIKPCGGCRERQRRLNQLFPYQ